MGTVGEHDPRRPVEGESTHPQIPIDTQMHRVDRHLGLVAQHVVPAGTHAGALGHQIDLDLYRRDAWLRHALVALVALLVLGAHVATLHARRVTIQNVGVIEEKAAQPEE